MTYPGQAVISPVVGVANYVPTPTAPTAGIANRTQVLNPPAPVVAQAPASAGLQVTAQVTAQARHNPDPYNTSTPAIGIPARVPFPTPLGVYPQFETPTQNWTYDYGDGEGGGFGSNY
jgi:hypothetical protein